MRYDIDTLEDTLGCLPTQVSIRKSALKVNGGDLNDLYDSDRFEQPKGYRSKCLHGHNAHKDHRDQTAARDARRQIRVIMGKD